MSSHPFHIVDKSPWPIIVSINITTMMISVLMMVKYKSTMLLFISMFVTLMSSFQWWRDITRESTYQGAHTVTVTKGLKIGMTLFIVSEIMFFFAFFWAFLHSSLAPSIQIGMMWPPLGIKTFDPTLIPLLNTTILISSGLTLTWAHHSMLNFNYKLTNRMLVLTIILGIYFTILQGWEYHMAPFTIADSVYGSIFFVATGFHGLHVIVGTTFLLVTLMRNIWMHFSPFHHFGFEASAWYWHFVDVVWLFLYSMVYWWGS